MGKPAALPDLSWWNAHGTTQPERSRLVFLLDALRCAPKKSKKLIGVVRRDDCTESYARVLDWLRDADDIMAAHDALRSRLR